MLKIKLTKNYDICISIGRKYFLPFILFTDLSNKPERFIVGIDRVLCVELLFVRIEFISTLDQKFSMRDV